MKVLIFNSLYYPYRIGGAEKSVQLLAESLVLYGNTVTVATLHEGKGIKEELINGVRIVRFPLK
ncbi:glycosyl transferase family 1, partial [Klebsiella pneumoniae]